MFMSDVSIKQSILGFTDDRWRCNRCGRWNGFRGISKSGEYHKKCSCGRSMRLAVVVRFGVPIIVMLSDGYRRCGRGTPKVVSQ